MNRVDDERDRETEIESAPPGRVLHWEEALRAGSHPRGAASAAAGREGAELGGCEGLRPGP